MSEEPLPSPPSPTRFSRACAGLARIPWAWLALVAFLVPLGIFLFRHVAPATIEPDDNGYFAQASLMLKTGQTYFTPESDAQYIGMQWLITPRNYYVSRYPPGFPVLIAAIYATFGYKAAVSANILLALLGLCGFFLAARRIVPAGWALVGVALLALNPTFMHHALGCYAHMAVLFCLVWAIYLALRWRDEGRLWQVGILGLILGCIPSVRYGDSITGGAFLVFALCNIARHRRIWLHYLVAAAAAAIPLTMLLVHNQVVMGSFWKTGYALTNEQTGFSYAYFKEHVVGYIRTANAGGLGLIYSLGLVGMVGMACARRTWRAGLLLTLVVVPMFLLYMAYYWGPQNSAAQTMRFLVPVFAPLVLAAVWVLAELTRNINIGGRIAIPAVLLGVQLLWGGGDILDGSDQTHFQKQSLAVVTEGLETVAAPGDVVVGSGNLLQHLDYVRKWKIADLSLLQGGGGGGRGGGRMGGNGDPTAPSPRQAQKAEVRRELYPQNAAERGDKYVADLQKWAGDHRVYFVGTADEMQQLLADKGPSEALTVVKRVVLPEAAVASSRGAGFGGGGGRGGRGGGAPPANAGGNGRRPGGGFGGPGGGMGGMRGGLGNARELVIAQWTFGPSGVAQGKP